MAINYEKLVNWQIPEVEQRHRGRRLQSETLSLADAVQQLAAAHEHAIAAEGGRAP